MTIYYVVYSLLFLLSVIEISGKRFSNNVKWSITLGLIFISGFRYGVGLDYFNYARFFVDYDTFDFIEPGFKALVVLLYKLGLGTQSLFLLSSALALLPICYTLKKYYPQWFFTALLIFYASCQYFESFNIIRQYIAIGFLFMAYHIYEGSKRKAYCAMTFACMMHTSSIIVIIVAIVVNKILRNKAICFSSLIVSYIVGKFIFIILLDILGDFIFLNYIRYLDKVEARGVASGLFQVFLNIEACAFLLLTSKHIRNFNVIKLYVTSVCTYNIFINFYVALRLYWYFYIFLIIVTPMCICSISRKKKQRVFLLILATFVISIYTYVSIIDSPAYNNYELHLNLFDILSTNNYKW